MDTVVHIDICGDGRIAEILQDADNAVVEAMTCETLDGWVPDIGLTTYSHRSIYRPPVVARSGLPTTLAHRFWRTSEGLMDHTGTRWIGVLIYDQHGEACPMELHLGGQPVGRLEPIRHDNRRHLIVVNRPGELYGGMEVFQITAPGPGTYRIEAFVFLAARPQPSTFVPKIQYLSTRVSYTNAEIHFVTDVVARVEVVAWSGDTEIARAGREDVAKLHALSLGRLADGQYRIDVLAIGVDGESARKSLELSIRAAAPARPGKETRPSPVTVPVEITAVPAAGGGEVGAPLTFGVPLPRDRFSHELTGRFVVAGTSLPAQCRVHSRWPGGSARWVLVDAALPVALPSDRTIAGALDIQAVDRTQHRLIDDAAQEGGNGVRPGAHPVAQVVSCARTDRRCMLTGEHLRVELDADDPVFPASVSARSGTRNWRPVLSLPPAQESTRQRTEAGPNAERAAPPLEVRLANGTALVPRYWPPVCEERGSERGVMLYWVDHCDSTGTPHLRSTVRVHLYGKQRYLRVQHRLEVVSPALGPAAGEADGTPATDAPHGNRPEDGGRDVATPDDVVSCVGRGPGEENSLLEVGSMVAHLPIAGVRTLVADGVRYGMTRDLGAARWSIVQEDDRSYHVDAFPAASAGSVVEGRYAGRLLLETDELGLVGLAVRRFWQTYPKGLRVDASGATVELLPPRVALSARNPPASPPRTQPASGDPGSAPEGEDETWHQLYFWRTEHGYLLKAGQALTSEIVVGLPSSPEEFQSTAAWVEQPAVVRPTIDWLNQSQALSPICGKGSSPLPRYERAVDQACGEWLRERQNLRQYGFLNFGDWYGESGWSWGNNEYDPPFAHYQEFLRGGKAEWSVLAAEGVRHLVDVDTCNYSSDRAQVGGQYGHMPGHAGGYLPPYFRSKVGSSCMFYSHSWVEGPILHYLLSGDESVRESLTRIGEWMLAGRSRGVIGGSVVVERQGLDAYDYGQLRDASWHLIHLCALARWSDDPRFMNAAHLVAARILERRTPEGGWERLLTEGHCFSGPPRTRGEASFMVGVCLSALRRYHELTGDESVATAIVEGARWLVDNTYDRDARHFRYTSSPTRGSVGPAHTEQVIEGLVYALSLRSDPALADIVHRALDTLGRERRAADPLSRGASGASTARGVGPSLCHETRYVPTMLAYLPPSTERRG